MQRMRLLLVAGLTSVVALSASAQYQKYHTWIESSAPVSKQRTAIEPSHWGKYGNAEEPATRPFKAFWRGLKAFHYQIGATIDEGHRKAGHAGGGVQFFRGVRRGLVEIGGGTYMGMAGQYPLPVEQTHPINEYIDSDRRLAALADLPSTAAILWYGGATSVGTVFGTGAITVAQSEVDRHAMTPEERAEVARAAAKFSKQQWPASAHDRNTPRPGGLKYVGEWKEADDAAKREGKPLEGNPYSGDMLKKARKGSIRDN
ncbi:MAG: hypothetical protein HUU46_06270 [Candidatus Hydrogenedentes bacterium]|nr:hypothetical protein [Candidatus Hydrogenedentota bacterium]